MSPESQKTCLMEVAGGDLKCEFTDLELIWKAMESHSRILERGDVVRGWPVRFIRCPCRGMAGAGMECRLLLRSDFPGETKKRKKGKEKRTGLYILGNLHGWEAIVGRSSEG